MTNRKQPPNPGISEVVYRRFDCSKKNTEQNKIDADHSNQLLRPYRKKKKKQKQKRPGVFRLVTTGSNIFLDLPHDKSLDLL